MSSDTSSLITETVKALQAEVPALEGLKLIFGLDLQAHGDVQSFRVELPGPDVAKRYADDGRVNVQMRREAFNELAEDPTLTKAQALLEKGLIKPSGDPNIIKLIGQVADKQLSRARKAG